MNRSTKGNTKVLVLERGQAFKNLRETKPEKKAPFIIQLTTGNTMHLPFSMTGSKICGILRAQTPCGPT